MAIFILLYLISSICIAAEEEGICARVRIQLSQDVVIARNAFKATLEITNTPENVPLKNLTVILNITDENDQSANSLFGIHPPELSGVGDVNGDGIIQPGTTAIASWLLVPTRDAAPDGPVMYYVGGEFSYTQGGSTITMPLFPVPILVKPDPLLVLDYFWAKDVYGDDPFTPEIEPSEPFALGLMVRNNGKGMANNFRIISSQPQIIENEKGLLVDFRIIGAQVNSEPVFPSLGVDLGNIDPGTTAVAIWMMTSSLQGQFIDYDATFTHIDGLGNPRLSLIDTVNIHELTHVVRVDTPDDDNKPDFLAKDGDIYRVYDSANVDSEVTDQTGSSTLSFVEQNGSQVAYTLETPAGIGFIYVKLPDPFNGQKVIKEMRSDGKLLPVENVWLSKTRQEDLGWDYYINVFDADSTGRYTLKLEACTDCDRDGMLDAWEQQIVDADPNDAIETIGDVRPEDDFDGDNWSNLQEYLAGTDPTLNNAPTIPEIFSPEDKAEVTTLQPELVIHNSTDPEGNEITYAFELYADETITTLVASQLNVPEGPQTTSWAAFDALDDNTWYYWRVKATDGSGFSKWAYGSFFVNTANDPPGSFATSSPQDGTEVDTLRPTLEVTNSVDADGDRLTYTFEVYADSGMSPPISSVEDIEAGKDGTTWWQVPSALTDNTSYFWRAIATDEHGVQTVTPLASFLVNTSNHAPIMTGIISPLSESEVVTQELDLVVANASDEDADGLTYVFELDRIHTFDSATKVTSGEIPEGTDTTSWHVSDLVDNTLYYWRAKASDGVAESGWVYGSFFVNTANDNPATPTMRNPGSMAWVDTPTPTLEVNRAPDADHDSISYEFELYADDSLSNLIAQGTSDIGAWAVPSPLDDRNWYYWQARAKDEHDAVSAWTELTSFFVKDNGINDPPHITLVEPAIDVETSGDSVVITWEDTDPDSNATIALYYDTDGVGADGTVIVDGLKEDPDGQNDAYVWDISGMACGTYHVYATILDETSSYTSYSQGSITITKEVTLDLPSGWSMISLPIDATDKRLKAVFPNAMVVYRYEKGTGYVRVKEDEALTVGKGYWILLDQATSYTITGCPIQSYTLSPASEEEWTMIGGCTNPAKVVPQDCNVGVIYRYVQGIGYQRVLASQRLNTGEGYWILLTDTADGATITVETVD